MRIGLYPNRDRDPELKITSRTARIIREHGGVPVLAWDFAQLPEFQVVEAEPGSYDTCQSLISLGGDGTFLSAAHLPGCEQIPMIGVNLGSVGFLPEIRPNDLENALPQLLHGPWHMEQRMMLEIHAFDPSGNLIESGFALNDAVISRGGRSRIVTLELSVDHDMIDRIPGDGLIVSTPTGSTAYSLSSGGPIVHPAQSLILMTPICPHTLHNRTYIASDTSRVQVRVCDYPYQAMLAIDGRQEVSLDAGSVIRIVRSPRNFKLIRLGSDRFFNTLPDKLHARGMLP